jgi:aminopeptidase
MEPRNRTLAETLVGYSLDLRPGENLLVEANGLDARDLLKEIVTSALGRGANVYTNLHDDGILRRILLSGSDEQIGALVRFDLERMKAMQAYIAIRGSDNVAELGDVPPAKLRAYQQRVLKPIHTDVRVPKTRWCVLRYPNAAMAQLAGTSREAFADFYFNVCTLDYARMSRAMDPLSALMSKTDRVEIRAPGTDLRFSIRGIPNVKCDGKVNIPDGELFTAPVRDSVNGVIRYNCASLYEGTIYRSIELTFEAGKVVRAECASDPEKLNAVLDRDEGARYLGEFSLGFNPYITSPILDTLFDEKIDGSIHTALGNAYETADNGNRSSVHWDLVLSQRPEVGGGEIVFDGRVIRRDGRFVVPELEGLNPENLAHAN